MPELAAHLERVAKELSEQIIDALPGLGDTTWLAERVAKIKPILAAALAACAREERETLRKSFIEAIREHPFDGYTLCKCRSEKFDIPMEELAKKYTRINRHVFEAEQRKAYAEHVAEIAAGREREA